MLVCNAVHEAYHADGVGGGTCDMLGQSTRYQLEILDACLGKLRLFEGADLQSRVDVLDTVNACLYTCACFQSKNDLLTNAFA